LSKLTLLQMTQDILSAIDGDEVNSISDTVESMQVAQEIRTTYYDLIATLSLPERRGLTHLDSLADVTRPNYLRIPDEVKDITWVRYNDVLVNYLDPKSFLDRIFSTSVGNFAVSDLGGVSYNVLSNRDPLYYTSFDDTHLAFDSFNVAAESTLQASNSLVYADLNHQFRLEDDFTADIDDNIYPTFLAEAKNACFINMKQVSNSNEAARARRGLVRMQNEFYRTARGNPAKRLPDYGRRR
jgi:hypothetical protein